jgi:hypothetical protein
MISVCCILPNLSIDKALGLFSASPAAPPGQMLTCCLPRMQSSQRRHQQSEQQDQLRREMKLLWAKARNACLCLLLETVCRPFLGKQAAGDAERLSFDYSSTAGGSSGRSNEEWSERLLKELEAEAYPYQVNVFATCLHGPAPAEGMPIKRQQGTARQWSLWDGVCESFSNMLSNAAGWTSSASNPRPLPMQLTSMMMGEP